MHAADATALRRTSIIRGMQTPSESPEFIGAEATVPLLTAVAAMATTETLREFAGMQTPAHFDGAAAELAALTSSCGVYDLGWRARLRITGEDRVRWLNGMVTNTVKDLPAGRLNYTFLLNAQGRIQGDGEVYALDKELLLVTHKAQAQKLAEHLDRFIIMDEVELALDDSAEALGLAGPHAEAMLAKLGLSAETMAAGSLALHDGVVAAKDDAGHFTLWVEPTAIPALWNKLIAAGAVPCGIDAVESLRVLEGRPRYGIDIHEKTLAQETGQMRALNFNKGCYLGQEIVERIRSRATVHRGICCIALDGALPAPGESLFAENTPDTVLGTLTSITAVDNPALPDALRGVFALGTVRTEAAGSTLRYAGGMARILDRAPVSHQATQ
jgi:folate-binding protein YgfZ